MTQRLETNTENIILANGISAWFRQNYSGTFLELGDIEDVSVALDPTFDEVYSSRFGVRALRKRLTTQQNATVNFTLREPTWRNLQRATYGGTPSYAQSVTVYEAAVLTVKAADTFGVYVDFADAEDQYAAVATIVGVYRTTDLNMSNALAVETVPGADNFLHFVAANETNMPSAGDEVLVLYTVTQAGCVKFELFGATDTTIEGDAQFQVRCQDGGIAQIWDIASAVLAPGGDISYAMDSHQTMPLSMTLQERSGTFGYLYTV